MRDLAHRMLVTSAGLRALENAPSQLRDAAGHALSEVLDKLERRVRVRARGRGAHAGERLREVLERDRAVRTADLLRLAKVSPAVSEPAPTPADAAQPAPARTDEPPPGAPTICDEPIRTRTLARLFAAQGDCARALRMYDYLIATNAPDRTKLIEEAETLRRSLADSA